MFHSISRGLRSNSLVFTQSNYHCKLRLWTCKRTYSEITPANVNLLRPISVGLLPTYNVVILLPFFFQCTHRSTACASSNSSSHRIVHRPIGAYQTIHLNIARLSTKKSIVSAPIDTIINPFIDLSPVHAPT